MSQTVIVLDAFALSGAVVLAPAVDAPAATAIARITTAT
jgi:hypothetical protein